MISSFTGEFYKYNQRNIFRVLGYKRIEEQLLDLDYYRVLENLTHTDMKVLFWGFGQNVFAPLEIQRASGFLYPQYAFGNNANAQIVRERYILDLETQKPDVIVELVGNSTFGLVDTTRHTIRNGHPDLYNRINERYNIIVHENDLIVWKKKL